VLRRNRAGGGSVLLTGLILAAVILVAGGIGFNLLRQPFQKKTVDRSPAPVLVALRDLASYEAASAQFEVMVDVEHDVKYVPSAIAGDRVLFIGVGEVRASVDFSGLHAGNVEVTGNREGVTVRLPAPALEDAIVDPERSHVANRDRGVLDRLGGLFSDNPTGERDLYLVAADKMQAAARETGLRQLAEDNTRTMLYTLLRRLGFEQIDIEFASEPAT
jgi:hypothetical protein